VDASTAPGGAPLVSSEILPSLIMTFSFTIYGVIETPQTYVMRAQRKQRLETCQRSL
jgi:hypothetical protein